MGLFSGIGSFFGPIGTVLGGIGDDLLGRDDAQTANQTAYAQQRELRQTAYQDTTQDLQKAGLNPMLAFSNGATAASAGPPVLNKGISAAQQNSATASAENLNADTENKDAQKDLMEAQAAEVRSRIPMNTNSAEKIVQETANMKQDISRILSSDKLLQNQALESGARAQLYRIQTDVAEVEKRLKQNTIGLQGSQAALNKAQKEYNEIMTKLKGYEESKAINENMYQLSPMGEYEPYARGLSTYGDAAFAGINGAAKAVKIFSKGAKK